MLLVAFMLLWMLYLLDVVSVHWYFSRRCSSSTTRYVVLFSILTLVMYINLVAAGFLLCLLFTWWHCFAPLGGS